MNPHGDDFKKKLLDHQNPFYWRDFDLDYITCATPCGLMAFCSTELLASLPAVAPPLLSEICATWAAVRRVFKCRITLKEEVLWFPIFNKPDLVPGGRILKCAPVATAGFLSLGDLLSISGDLSPEAAVCVARRRGAAVPFSVLTLLCAQLKEAPGPNWLNLARGSSQGLFPPPMPVFKLRSEVADGRLAEIPLRLLYLLVLEMMAGGLTTRQLTHANVSDHGIEADGHNDGSPGNVPSLQGSPF